MNEEILEYGTPTIGDVSDVTIVYGEPLPDVQLDEAETNVEVQLSEADVAAAAANAYVSISFSNGGNNYIFSDNPETVVYTNEDDLFYMWGCSLSTSPKDVEMYHHVNNEDDFAGYIQYGVAIWNANSYPITITNKYVSAMKIWGGDESMVSLVTPKLSTFLNSSSSTKQIPANGIGLFAVKQATNRESKSIYFRGQFQSSASSNVWMRVFIAGDDSIDNGQALFNKPTYVTGLVNQFTGEMTYTRKIATLSASNSYQFAYYENDAAMIARNTNEYTGVMSYKPNGNTYLVVNYGAIYQFTVTGAAGRTMQIDPDVNKQNRENASIVYRVNGGSWQYSIKQRTQFPFGIYLGTSNTATVEISIPSGNNGFYKINFV